MAYFSSWLYHLSKHDICTACKLVVGARIYKYASGSKVSLQSRNQLFRYKYIAIESKVHHDP